jgi:hypothetical protein
MNKKSKPTRDRTIISAGEVATYVVCPESWRLERLHGTSGSDRSENSRMGKRLQTSWAENLDEARYLLIGVRIILYLVILAILSLLYLISHY